MEIELFYIFLVSGILTWLGIITRYCYKSKCRQIDCWCIHCLRDIDADNENRRNNSGSSYNNTLTPMNPSAIQL